MSRMTTSPAAICRSGSRSSRGADSDAIGVARARGDKVVLGSMSRPKPRACLRPAAHGGQIALPLSSLPAGDAPVVTKAHADAFQETDLKAHLGGTSELLICGMMTRTA